MDVDPKEFSLDTPLGFAIKYEAVVPDQNYVNKSYFSGEYADWVSALVQGCIIRKREDADRLVAHLQRQYPKIAACLSVIHAWQYQADGSTTS